MVSVSDISALDTAIGAMIAADRSEAAPSTLLPSVMQTVWADLRRSAMIPLACPGGPASVAAHVVATMIDSTLDALQTLQVRTCSVSAVAPPDDAAARDRTHVAVALSVALAFGSDVHAVAEDGRERVAAMLAAQFGFVAESIDIVVIDVYLTPVSA